MMKQRHFWLKSIPLILVAIALLTSPSAVMAQETTPIPQQTQDSPYAENDILVIVPEFKVEIPIVGDFKISFNFGIKFEVPHQLMLANNDILNFLLNFDAYLIPGGGSTSTPTPTPFPDTPTPSSTPTPNP